MAQIDPPVEQREGEVLPGGVTLSKSTQASELPRSPNEQGDEDPSGKIAEDLSQPVAVTKSPVEQVNSSPQIAKRNKSNDSTSSPSPHPSQEGGVGTPPCHSQEGIMDGTDQSRKKRGLLSIICPCFG